MSESTSQLDNRLRPFPGEAPTSHRTMQNHYEAACGMCGRLLYVDQDTLGRVSYATASGLDNPLRCDDCERQYDDLAYEG